MAIRRAIKRETNQDILHPREQASNGMFLAKTIENKCYKACMSNYQLTRSKGG